MFFFHLILRKIPKLLIMSTKNATLLQLRDKQQGKHGMFAVLEEVLKKAKALENILLKCERLKM